MPNTGPEAAAAAFDALLGRAREDSAIIGFWLGGSRGMGRATAHSDYDCGLVTTDEAAAGVRADLEAIRQPGLDLVVMGLSAFERYAAWGSAEAWDRYSFAHLTTLVDKTGRIQPLIEAKGRVPPEYVSDFIDARLDHCINQLYRSLKCMRDGDEAASRMEAAEAAAPFLDGLFALHDGRLRPYYKYLAWELETWPLSRLPFGGEELIARLLATLGEGGGVALRGLLGDTLALFAVAGHGATISAWGEATLDWMLGRSS